MFIFLNSHLGAQKIELIPAEKELPRTFILHHKTESPPVFQAKDFRHGTSSVCFFGRWKFGHGKGFEAMKMTISQHTLFFIRISLLHSTPLKGRYPEYACLLLSVQEQHWGAAPQPVPRKPLSSRVTQVLRRGYKTRTDVVVLPQNVLLASGSLQSRNFPSHRWF